MTLTDGRNAATATATATSGARRSARIDRGTVRPALLVLALAVLMGVVLPSIDGATSYRDQIDKGDVAKVADALTLVPAPGWDLAEGALIGRTRSPLGTTATTEIVEGSAEVRVQTAPFDGTPSALLTRVNKIDADLESVQGSPVATTRRYAVRTRQGAVGVAEDFLGVHKQGTIVAFVFRSRGQSTSSQGERRARAWRSSPPVPRLPSRAGAMTSSR